MSKLSRPRLHRAVARQRLFSLLDRARRERAASCVIGPPGAGKTTLVASWLDTREIPGVWYQVDGGDADLSTFFYYLCAAMKPFSRRGQRPLPLLTPEYLADISGFARRFFRDLFARLPAGATVTLDNYQEVPPDEGFHRIIALAVDEVPPGMSLVVISRRDPPDCYARLLANENVSLLDWENLKLDRDEADAIAQRHRRVPADVLAQLHEATGGWAAGLVLALESAATLREPAEVAHSTRDATFSYFAAEILSRVPVETQRVLMWTAYLPDIPVSIAQHLTGNPNAGIILEDLYQRHLFTHRKPGAEPTYWYHALFQSFLRLQSVQRLDAGELAQIRMRAAALLADRNLDAAVALYCELQAWDEAQLLIVQGAPSLIGQGRWKVVTEQISRLPPDRVADSHWLSCWLGIALTVTAPVEARRHLERGFVLATARSDAPCRVRTAAGVIQTYLLEYNQFRPLDKWAEALLEAISESTFASADSEGLAQSALVTALSFRQPSHPALERCALRVFELLPAVPDMNLRLSAAVSVLAWGSLAGPIEMAHRALPVVTSLWRHVEITPINAAVAGYLISWYHCLLRNKKDCLCALAVLEDIYEKEGLPIAGSYAGTIGAWRELYETDVPAAQRWCDLLAATADITRPFDRASLDGIKAWVCLLNKQPKAGMEYAARSVETFDELGSVLHQAAFRQNLLWCHLLLGEWDEARRHIRDTRAIVADFGSGWFEIHLRVAEAYIALESGDRTMAEEHLRAAFSLCRERALDHGWNILRPWMPRLCAVALNAGIQTEVVQRLIRLYAWKAPADRPEAWPWPVRIHALGGFRVLVNDLPLTFPRKTPRKPIALLKAILAFGGRDVATSKLIDALWPEDDGDNAYHSFGLALHRLRKLLGHADAVLLSEAKVSLNDEIVWTDVSLCERAFGSWNAASGDLDIALRVYRGHFLADADESPWSIARREQLRKKFVHCVVEFARQCELAGNFDQASAWYVRALETDVLAEEFYQGLMRCHAAQGQRQEAEAVFDRLKHVCQLKLGSPPSSKTLALARSLSLDIGA